MATLTETPLARRGGENRIIGSNGRPLLIIVSGHEIDAMIDAGMEAIGGMARYLAGGKQVVLKPNTNQRDPFPSITDPATMRAVARHCQSAGVERIVVHEDHKREMDLYYEPTELPGMEVLLSHSPTPENYVLVEHQEWHGDVDPNEAYADLEPKGMLARLLEDDYPRTSGHRIRVARELQEASFIINMPVLKRHFAGQITSALKNHFGSVYGPHRWLAHVALQKNRDYFDRKLVEFASAVRPELTITDVRSLQAISGPGRGDDTRIIEDVNKLIITGDMVAADTVALELMKEFDPSFTKTNEGIVLRQHQHAEELGLGSGDLSKFEIIEVSV